MFEHGLKDHVEFHRIVCECVYNCTLICGCNGWNWGKCNCCFHACLTNAHIYLVRNVLFGTFHVFWRTVDPVKILNY